MDTRLAFVLVPFLTLASPASAVTIDWVTVGDPGNPCDAQSQGCFGSVAYSCRISKYEVTNAQYVEFLNAKAASDPLGLYVTLMGSGLGGITRSGSDGSYIYSAIAGRENMSANFVSFYDALRFANWLHNGQGSGDTETGAYTLLGGTAIPSNGLTVTRNTGATIFPHERGRVVQGRLLRRTLRELLRLPSGYRRADRLCGAWSDSEYCQLWTGGR